jgi:hypothetical protein
MRNDFDINPTRLALQPFIVTFKKPYSELFITDGITKGSV